MLSFWKTMLKGLGAILPVLITAYVVYWVVSTMELLVGGLLKFLFLGSIYVPGMGIATGLALLFVAGMLMERSGFTQKAYAFIDKQLERIPLVKSLYGGLRDLMQFFSAEDNGKKEKKVVLVTLPNELRLIGLVTGEAIESVGNVLGKEQHVAVYLPMSYQVGGFTAYLPHSKLETLDMSVEEAMRIVLTGGIVKKE